MNKIKEEKYGLVIIDDNGFTRLYDATNEDVWREFIVEGVEKGAIPSKVAFEATRLISIQCLAMAINHLQEHTDIFHASSHNFEILPIEERWAKGKGQFNS